MKNYLNASEIKEQVSMEDLLSKLGYQPVKKSGGESFYLSMLRDSDTKPSFCVNNRLNVWYDHGLGKGGNVIDFGLAFWNPSSFSSVLQKISDLSNVTSQPSVKRELDLNSRSRSPVKIPNYKIEDIKSLGNNDAITGYLQYRGVWDVADKNLNEVYYYVEDDKKNRKQFFAAGWENENGGWEVRNKYFKGCLGSKGMTFIPGLSCDLMVFEGYMNYLSWLSEHRNSKPCILVLNSLSFLQAAIRRMHQFDGITVFFDHDQSGYLAKEQFLAAVPSAKNGSYIYEGYNDYNDKIRADREEHFSREATPKSGLMSNLKVGFSR